MKNICAYILIFFSLSVSNLFSQDIPEAGLKTDKRKLPVIENSSSNQKYAALYLSPGIYIYSVNDLMLGKVVLTGDISFQINKWFYLNFKGDVFHVKEKTYGVIASILPAAGFQVFNNRSMLLSGVGFSLIEDGHAGHPDLPELTITAFSRYRYEITRMFGIFSEIRYGITPYESNKIHHLFFNAGISLQVPLHRAASAN